MPERLASANPTATKDDVIVIKHGCLPRSHGPLRIVQPHAGTSAVERRQCSACRWMTVANLYCCFDFVVIAGLVDPGDWMPICSVDLEFVRHQIISISDNYAIHRRIQIDNVARSWRAARQSFSLANREKLDAVVFAQEIPGNIVNLAAVKLIFAQMRTQKCLVIVAGNKTDFLAIRLVGNFEA